MIERTDMNTNKVFEDNLFDIACGIVRFHADIIRHETDVLNRLRDDLKQNQEEKQEK